VLTILYLHLKTVLHIVSVLMIIAKWGFKIHASLEILSQSHNSRGGVTVW